MDEQVLLALEYLQKHHIAHRDVRSDNLLLNASGIVKVGKWPPYMLDCLLRSSLVLLPSFVYYW